jgi:hypothetical protein
LTGINSRATAPPGERDSHRRRHMPLELFRNDGHVCLMFSDLSGPSSEAVQANQFLVVDDGTSAIIASSQGPQGLLQQDR